MPKLIVTQSGFSFLNLGAFVPVRPTFVVISPILDHWDDFKTGFNQGYHSVSSPTKAP